MEPKPKRVLLWHKIFFFIYFHIAAIYGVFILTTAKWQTILWFLIQVQMSVHGITVGAHRFWSHRSFKAKLPLRLLLAFDQTLTFQFSIYDWVLDHRLHHKYTDTEFDPHDASKGFWYSHLMWIFLKRTPELVRKGEELDLSDLEADPIVMFQRKYYWYIAPLVAFGFPALVPWYFWDEPFWTSWYICSMLRYFISVHITSSINSFAHTWGNKPYDKNIRPVENSFVTHITFGEGFHNYHHVFPWDYKAAELGNFFGNSNAKFIDLMAKIGWAYDLKCASLEMVIKRAKRTGDGSKKWEENVWGWGDTNMKQEDVAMATILHQSVSNE